ncbi:bacteriophytochrome BphP [soil metagenome]
MWLLRKILLILMTSSPEPVTLANCDREPIHIPGLVQSHGALIAFDADGMAIYVSENARELLGSSAPSAGDTLLSSHFEGQSEVHVLLSEARDVDLAAAEGETANVDIEMNGTLFDLVVHRAVGGGAIAEFEMRPTAPDDVAAFAIKAHRVMDKLKRQTSIDALLTLSVGMVRQLTGFDRVMAYRFRHDDSGDVVAEDRVDALEPFVGRRYPASDIPAQARRLYVINTLRLIADVNAPPVGLVGASTALLPLDMSHCVLRSVSPIHIEYLRNMGVGASMSISIIVNGRLWGMLACHHRAPLQVPYSVRMACDVIAQVLAANVQSQLARTRAQRVAAAAQMRTGLIEAVLHADDAVAVLVSMAPVLAEAFEAEAVLVAQGAGLQVHGAVPEAAAAQLVQWLNGRELSRDAVLAIRAAADMPEGLAAQCAPWCGMLAIRFDDLAGGWLVFLRKEQIETISWSGKPDKEYASGPLGPRLTPRGSFDVWKETVRGTSVPWTAEQLELAHQLRDELLRAGASRLAEVHRARSHLLAMLGHDLRDPLQSIAMAAKVLELGSNDAGNRLGQRIQPSSSRMGRLIGQVLDASKLQTGGGLELHFAEVDLSRLLEDLLDEARTAYPGVVLLQDMPSSLMATADPDRIAQLFSNLVSNARHHGTAGEPVRVTLGQDGDEVRLQVRNTAPPIAADLVPNLYSAFKRQVIANERNKGGLGLGLHIAQAIASGHNGEIVYRYEAPYVVFEVRWPSKRVNASTPSSLSH